MANKDLALKPQDINDAFWYYEEPNINDAFWYYEEPKGICVVRNGKDQFSIPWGKIRRSLKRKDAVTKRKEG
jgi:hypothetical protein